MAVPSCHVYRMRSLEASRREVEEKEESSSLQDMARGVYLTHPAQAWCCQSSWRDGQRAQKLRHYDCPRRHIISSLGISSESIAFGALGASYVGFCIAVIRQTTSMIDDTHLQSSPLPATRSTLRFQDSNHRVRSTQVPAAVPLQNIR